MKHIFPIIFNNILSRVLYEKKLIKYGVFLIFLKKNIRIKFESFSKYIKRISDASILKILLSKSNETSI